MSSRFGVNAGFNVPWKDLEHNAQAAEDAGFHSLWLPDHLANPLAETEWLEAWTTLAAIAAVTSRIRIGTLVSNIIYRHPALLAKQAITVDRISGGRLDIGVGTGGAPLCHSMTDTPMWSPAERQSRFAEYIELLDLLLRSERTDFKGEYYSTTGAVMIPGPIQTPRPPLLIAAHGPRALDVAAHYADTWNFTDAQPGLTGQAAADATAELNNLLTEKAIAAGRDPDNIIRSMTCGFAASSAWDSIEAAVEGVALFEQAGINEFIFPYGPAGDHPPALEFRAQLAKAGVTLMLNDEQDLRQLASALDLS